MGQNGLKGRLPGLRGIATIVVIDQATLPMGTSLSLCLE